MDSGEGGWGMGGGSMSNDLYYCAPFQWSDAAHDHIMYPHASRRPARVAPVLLGRSMFFNTDFLHPISFNTARVTDMS